MQQRKMSSWPSAHWEELRRQSRKLENEIDTKLANLSKISSQSRKFSGWPESKGKPNDDSVPLLSSSTSDEFRLFDTYSGELNDLLTKLGELNEQMSDCMNKFTSAPGAALLHTLQRHRDIYQDYKQEYNKIMANAEQMRSRDELLGSSRIDPAGISKRPDGLVRESEHLRNSERMIDEQIGIAVMTKENLHNQRNTIRNVVNRLGNISNRFPMINSLVQRINWRKRRDAIILGTVIGICCFFFLVLITK